MSVFFIPTPATQGNYRQLITLDGVQFGIVLLWNARVSRWFMTLEDIDGNVVVAGFKLTADMPWAGHMISDMPAGKLWVSASGGDDSDPGLRELGIPLRVALVYADEEASA